MEDWIWQLALAMILAVGLTFLVIWMRKMFRELAELRAKDDERLRAAALADRVVDPELAHFLAAHVYGVSVRRKFVPDEWDGPIKCLSCGNDLIGGQFFWDTPLLDRDTLAPVGKSFQICMSCQPGDVEAITHGQ